MAQEAGVSIATVNRVVAGAPGVREETALKVAEAAARIGYHGHTLMSQQATALLPEVRIGVLLQKEKQSFYRGFADHLVRSAADCTTARVKLVLEFAASAAPRDAAAQLDRMASRVDVLAAVAVNHPAVSETVNRLSANGVPTFALLSEFAQGTRRSYIGTNNLKIGRGAAHALSFAAGEQGKIALFVGGNRWHGHELRETGFRAHFRENAPGFTLLDTFINLDTRQLTYEATIDLLERHPDLVGLYLAGGGVEGAFAALREERVPGQTAMVANEWTPESQQAMDDGYVSLIVGTPLEQLSNIAIAMMVEAHQAPDRMQNGQVFLDPTLYLPEFF